MTGVLDIVELALRRSLPVTYLHLILFGLILAANLLLLTVGGMILATSDKRRNARKMILSVFFSTLGVICSQIAYLPLAFLGGFILLYVQYASTQKLETTSLLSISASIVVYYISWIAVSAYGYVRGWRIGQSDEESAR